MVLQQALLRQKKKYSSFEVFKYATVKIISSIPYIGAIYSTGADIFSALKAVKSDLNYMDKSGQVTAETRYTTKDFYHYLYLYNRNQWLSKGHSISKYYYKHLIMGFVDERSGDFLYAAHNFRDNPETIAEAKHYMNKRALTDIVYEGWRNWGDNWSYTETYLVK